MNKKETWEPTPAPGPANFEILKHFKHGQPSDVYEYHGVDGRVLSSVRRFDLSGGEKVFIPLTYGSLDGQEGWYSKALPSPRPLYRLTALLKRPGRKVLVVEGEKTAKAAASLFPDLNVVTSMGGAKAAEKTDWTPVAGCELVIWPDNDEPGAEYASKVRDLAIQAGARSISAIEVDERFPCGWDLADRLPDGIPFEEICGLLEHCRRVGSQDTQRPEAASTAPDLGKEAYYGLAGDILRTIEPHSEAHPAAILLQLFVMFVNFVGRTAYWSVEGIKHHLIVFLLIIGRSAGGRKGTSLGQVKRLFDLIDDQWTRNHVKSGLSSGEGVISHVRDPVPDKNDPGVQDKRLLIVESEFGQVLRVSGREGNTLSAVLRRAWDGDDLCVMTKIPITATAPHICIVGHITEQELKKYLGETDIANGFANRFLMAFVERTKSLPFGGDLNEADLIPLAESLKKAAYFAREVGEMPLTEAAKDIWRAVYDQLTDRPGTLFGTMTARAAPQVRRLACVYALLDLRAEVDGEHLTAALCLWQFVEASCHSLFADSTGNSLADRILAALKAHPAGLRRTEITKTVLSGNYKKPVIDQALTLLQKMSLASSQGTSPEVWRTL